MTAEEGRRTLPDLVPHALATKAIGCCTRQLLTEYIRKGLLPRPDGACRWQKADIVRVLEQFDARRAATLARQRG